MHFAICQPPEVINAAYIFSSFNPCIPFTSPAILIRVDFLSLKLVIFFLTIPIFSVLFSFKVIFTWKTEIQYVKKQLLTYTVFSITEYLLDHLLLFLSVILLFQSHVQRKFTKAVALQQLSKCRNRIA